MASMPIQKPGRSKQEEKLIGKSFDRLTVISFHHKDKHHQKYYSCICACGKNKVISGSAILKGTTKSCGCLHMEKCKEPKLHRRLPNNGGVWNQLFLHYKRQAKFRKLYFSLTKDEVIAISNKNCHYCGTSPSNTYVAKNKVQYINYSGIDRKDSDLGYITSNCVPCCIACNRAKSNLSYDEFISWLNQVVSFRSKL